MKSLGFAMKDLFAHYLNWKGRLSRAGYWWAWLGVFLIGLVFSLLGTFVHEAVSYLGDLWSLVTLLPMFFAAMRRYHDSGKPGWLALLLSVLTEIFMLIGLTVLIVSIAGLSVGAMDGEPGAAVALFGTSGIFLVLMLAGLVVNFIMLVLPSTPGENRYGAPRPFDPNEGQEHTQSGIDLQ